MTSWRKEEKAAMDEESLNAYVMQTASHLGETHPL